MKARVAKAEAAEWQLQGQVRQRQQAGVRRLRKHRCISEQHAVQIVEQQCRERIKCKDELLRDELMPGAWRACAQQCACAVGLAQAVHLQLLPQWTGQLSIWESCSTRQHRPNGLRGSGI